MHIRTDFPMLVYAIALCTDEGYELLPVKDGTKITMGTYQPDWLRIRTKIIRYYRCKHPGWGE